MAQTRPREIFGLYDEKEKRKRRDIHTASASRDAGRARGHKAKADKARKTVENLERRLGRPSSSRERGGEPRKDDDEEEKRAAEQRRDARGEMEAHEAPRQRENPEREIPRRHGRPVVPDRSPLVETRLVR